MSISVDHHTNLGATVCGQIRIMIHHLDRDACEGLPYAQDAQTRTQVHALLALLAVADAATDYATLDAAYQQALAHYTQAMLRKY